MSGLTADAANKAGLSVTSSRAGLQEVLYSGGVPAVMQVRYHHGYRKCDVEENEFINHWLKLALLYHSHK